MKKSIKQKIVNPEAIYDCKIIKETTEVFLNFLQILKKEKLIYCLEQIEIFEYNCATFNNMFFGDKIPNISNISINKKHVNENIKEKEIIDKKLNILIKYSENKNFKKFKKISIEILDYLKMIYNNKIGNILDELKNEERYQIVALSNIFILISELKMMIQ